MRPSEGAQTMEVTEGLNLVLVVDLDDDVADNVCVLDSTCNLLW